MCRHICLSLANYVHCQQPNQCNQSRLGGCGPCFALPLTTHLLEGRKRTRLLNCDIRLSKRDILKSQRPPLGVCRQLTGGEIRERGRFRSGTRRRISWFDRPGKIDDASAPRLRDCAAILCYLCGSRPVAALRGVALPPVGAKGFTGRGPAASCCPSYGRLSWPRVAFASTIGRLNARTTVTPTRLRAFHAKRMAVRRSAPFPFSAFRS